jgi:lipopolysaccharide export system protein LptA
MRTTQANRYARWSVIIAALLIVAVFGVYLRRSWLASQARKNSPASVPASVERSSEGFTYTQGSGDHVLFTVRASSATTFKGSSDAAEKNALLDVSITVFGRKGDRHDVIHTRTCDFYRPISERIRDAKTLKFADKGSIACASDVQMDLQSAADEKRAANAAAGATVDPRIVHVVTKGVTFDSSTADAHTDQPVEFNFSGGQGRALGANYGSDDGTLELLHDVHLSLKAAPPKSARNPQKPATEPIPIDVTGSSVVFHRDAKIAVLHGPVVVKQVTPAPPSGNVLKGAAAARVGSHVLHANFVTVNLDADFRARQISAEGDAKSRPNVVMESPKGAGTLTADKFVTDLDPDGSAKHFSALGNVLGDFTNSASGETDHISAGRLDAEMVPKINQPRLVTVDGGVKMNSSRDGRTRSLETASAELNFVPGVAQRPGAPPSYHVDHARTLAPATLMTREPVTGAIQQRVTRTSGQQVEVAFDERNRMRRLLAHNGAQLDRDAPNKPHQSSASQELVAEFDPKGQWTTVDQTGNVRFQAGDQSGQAAKAHMDNETNIVTLTGSAEALDAGSRTTADTIVINQNQNEVRADGRVVTTFHKPSGNATAQASKTGIGTPLTLGPDPANITAEHLVGSSVTGRASYTGHARLWQGDSTMEADEIELNREGRQLDARGNVRAVFIQVGASSMAKPITAPAPPPSRSRGAATKPTATAKQNTSPPGPDVIRVRAATLTYWDAKSQAHMEGGCTAESRDGSISGQICDLFFAPSAKSEQPAPRTPLAGPGATQRLDHAVFTGNVVVRSEERRATGERGEYDSALAKFVISGGNPTLYDGSGKSTTGSQLTFLLADDTILVGSAEGTRTLTRYQVKK